MSYSDEEQIVDKIDDSEETSWKSLGIMFIIGSIAAIVVHLFFSPGKYYRGDDLFATQTTLASKIIYYDDPEESNFYYFRTADQKCQWRISEGALGALADNELTKQMKQLNPGDPVKVAYRVSEDNRLTNYNASVRVMGLSSGKQVFIAAKAVKSRDSDSLSNTMIICLIGLVAGSIMLIGHYRKKDSDDVFDVVNEDNA